MPSTLGLFDVMYESHNGKRYIRINIASGPEKPYYILKYGMSPRGCSIHIGSSTRNSKGKYNYAAYLLADVNGTSIKVAKYKGLERYDLIENKEYGYCSLFTAIKRVLDELEVENITLVKITAKEREEKNLVDKIALREA